MPRMRIRAALLLVLTAAACYTAGEAYRTLLPRTRDQIPMQIYTAFTAEAEQAQYFLKNCEGYVAVYGDAAYKTAPALTSIATAELRSADRAMLEKGIPVRGRSELLTLLEDLGS